MASTSYRVRANCALLSLFIVACILSPASAQVPGDTEDVNHDMTFSTSQTDVTLDDSPLKGQGPRLTFSKPLGISTQPPFGDGGQELIIETVVAFIEEYTSIEIPGWIFDFINGIGDFSFVSIEPTFSLGVDGRYGGFFEVSEVGTAGIVVSYPIDVTHIFPAENTFACNQTIDLETQLNIHTNSSLMDVQPPYYDLELGGFLDAGGLSFSVAIGVDISLCIGLPIPGTDECAGVEVSWCATWTESLPALLPDGTLDTDIPILQICEDVFEPKADELTLLECALGGDESFWKIMRNLVQGFDPGFSVASFDQDPRPIVEIFSPTLPTGAPPLPEMSGAFLKPADEHDLTFEANPDGSLHVGGTLEDVANLFFDAISLLDYTGIPTGFSLGADNNIDFGDLGPTLHIDRFMDYSLVPDIRVELDLGVEMAWEVLEEPGNSGFGRIVTMHPGNTLRMTYPPASDPTTVTNEYSMDGEFSTLSGHEYFFSVLINALQLTVAGFEFDPVIELMTPKTLLTNDIPNITIKGPNPHEVEDATFTLRGFNMPVLPPFVLNPEDPKLDINTMAVTDVVNLGRGERAIVYRLDLSNNGDVDLDRMTMNLNLDDTYAPPLSLEPHDVLCLHSDALTENDDYSGRCLAKGCAVIENCGKCTADSDCPEGESCEDDFCTGGPLPIDMLSSAVVACADEDSVSCTAGANPDGTIEVLVRVKPEISPVLENDCFGTVEYDAQARGTAVSPIDTCIMDRYDQCTNVDTADPIIANVDLGASVIEELADYTIYGWDAVDIARAFELSRGNVGSGGTFRLNPYTSQRSKDPRIIGDVHAGGDMFITQSHLEIDYMQLGGDLRLEDPNSSLTLTGAMNQSSSCVAVMPESKLVLPKMNSKESVSIAAGEIRVLQPGDYARITLEQDSELHLSNGTYNVALLRFNGGCADVKFDVSDGPITLNLHKWQMLPVTGLGFIVENGLTRDVQINYAGNKKQIFRGSVVQGTLIAPNAAIVFDDGSRLEGACYAERVKIGPFSSFTGHDFLEMLNMNVACHESLPRDGLIIPSNAPCE